MPLEKACVGRFHALVSTESQAQAALAGGAQVLQLRHKHLADRPFLELARKLRVWTRETKTQLVINDRLHVALAAEADGVHVGPHDLPAGRVRAIAPRPFLLGVSIDTPAEARVAAEAGADYVGAGPVFPTSSKDDAGDVLGTKGLRQIVQACPLPVIGIGGISLPTLPEVLDTGCWGFAVLSALTQSPEPEVIARKMAELLR